MAGNSSLNITKLRPKLFRNHKKRVSPTASSAINVSRENKREACAGDVPFPWRFRVEVQTMDTGKQIPYHSHIKCIVHGGFEE